VKIIEFKVRSRVDQLIQ